MSRRLCLLLICCLPLAAAAQQPDYTGSYQLNADLLRLFVVSYKGDSLQFTDQGRGAANMLLQPDGRYQVEGVKPKALVEFVADPSGHVNKMIIEQNGRFECFRISHSTDVPKAKRAPNRQNGFTRADTLRGMLLPARSCYDVKYYHLDVAIDPDAQTVSGSTLMRYTAVRPFRELQVDLYENMPVDSIVYRGRHLPYRREFDAVLVQFPAMVPAGAMEELRVYYHGKPQQPDPNVSMNGGFLWRRDNNGRLFAQVVCQGSGASLWWPDKDHLSDEPDSMLISVTMPEGLQNISNGRLRSRITLPDKRVRTEWAVTYPINNYNVTVNIGDYREITDRYVRNGDTLTMNIYHLPYSEERARFLLAKAKDMLRQFERLFGPYPFPADGFRLIETPYPMEHQGIVALGSFGGDTSALKELLWHEVAHEWWGNNVSCRDMADFWLHESFATYATMLMIAYEKGEKAALQRLAKEGGVNREPITGVRNVNHIHYEVWDAYAKGCRMLHMLRIMVNNDSLFFATLRGIQEKFALQTVTADQVTDYIMESTGLPLQPFFEQYLHRAALPELQLQFEKQRGGLRVNYRWHGAVKGFSMPVRVTTGRNSYDVIRPREEWQHITLEGMTEKDFKVDRENFYIESKTVTGAVYKASS
ncbi:M1 family metallopeptidase [Chitinophaga alhagiae]|uniref:M1 family metallopeptidase n=1 Tax=Chitinophaga alhagiae TaxID=2203219 RepID=UPI000E5C5189|nr:M1 family metallopeptidase [Chitinophaga alhagiae]